MPTNKFLILFLIAIVLLFTSEKCESISNNKFDITAEWIIDSTRFQTDMDIIPENILNDEA